ncbi:MAG: hypothetical protein IJH86_06980 [Clostridia bacterium]|nr:hypothetical protein [Clostridia bacterium]
MACFLVPATEAIVATVIRKAMEAKGVKPEKVKLNRDGRIETAEKLPFTHKLKWLTNLLWGGSALLAFEHVWHGEVVPWFPFLTAAADPADAAEMLHEMSTVGVTMAVLITVVWLGMVAVSGALENRALKPQAAKN